MNNKNSKNSTLKNNSHFSERGPRDLYIFTNSAHRYNMSAPKNSKKFTDNPQTNQPQTLNQTASQSTFFSSPLAYFTSKTTNPKNSSSTTLTIAPLQNIQ